MSKTQQSISDTSNLCMWMVNVSSSIEELCAKSLETLEGEKLATLSNHTTTFLELFENVCSILDDNNVNTDTEKLAQKTLKEFKNFNRIVQNRVVTKTEKDFSKYSYFPIRHPHLEEFFKMQYDAFWTPEEIDYVGDRDDWDALVGPKEGIKEFVTFILCFFAQSDGLVNENLIDNFMEDVRDIPELQRAYSAQVFFENIHNKTYGLLIETLFRDPVEKAHAFNAIAHYPSIKKIADWVMKWMDSDRPFIERNIAFICFEGMIFSSTFAGIYWVKRLNILKAVTKANELIARDEGVHTLLGITVFHHMTKVIKRHVRPSVETAHAIINEAQEVAAEFIRDALRVDLVGLDTEDMIKYVKCTGDKILESLNYPKMYNVESPFDWMAVISLVNTSSFFETKVTEYARQKEADFEWDLDADF